MEMPLPCGIPARTHKPEALLEALLFLSGQPMTAADICAHTGWSREETEAAASALEQVLDERRGLKLIRVAGGYQLVTRPELYDAVKWVRTGAAELSPMALEVLAIVAFKQPVTRADIEKLRGVSSERILSSLLQQGLIVDLGRTADHVRHVGIFFGMHRHGFAGRTGRPRAAGTDGACRRRDTGGYRWKGYRR